MKRVIPLPYSENKNLKNPEKQKASAIPSPKQSLKKSTLKGSIEELAIHLKTSKKVIKHPTLNTDRWTRNCYEMLADIITEDLNERLSSAQKMSLGTSLSSRTLRKIVSAEYKITHPIDPRKLNTLNKVVIFLGYTSWHQFVNKINHLQQHPQDDETPKTEIIKVVKEAINNEYTAYTHLPELTDKPLQKTHLENSPSFNFVMEVLREKYQKKLIISNNFNPSTYEILDISVKKLESKYAQVYTKEYWLLCWWDTTTKQYVQRYKNISDHFYILNRVNEHWKIKTNASTADPMELNNELT